MTRRHALSRRLIMSDQNLPLELLVRLTWHAFKPELDPVFLLTFLA